VLLMDDAETVARKFKRAVTDSGTEIRFDETRPAINNLLEIYNLITGKSQPEVEEHFAGKGYAQLKGDLADATIGFLGPIQQRVRETTDEQLDALLDQGREKASRIASATLQQVFERSGLTRAPNK
jgi:tryptophanyl-tRNA synthetase